MCASFSSFLFSLPLSLPCTPCCMWLPQGIKGQPGEKVSPHFPLCPSASAFAPTPVGSLGPSRSPQPSPPAGAQAKQSCQPGLLCSRPLPAQFPSSFHTIGQGHGVPGLRLGPRWPSGSPLPAEAAWGLGAPIPSLGQSVALPRGKGHTSRCFLWDAAPCPPPSRAQAGSFCQSITSHLRLCSTHPSSSFCCPPHQVLPKRYPSVSL